jgi:hypothetical protein
VGEIKMKDRVLLLTTPPSSVQWEMHFYNNQTVDMTDNKGNVLGTYPWTMQHETVYVNRGTGWWPVDNLIANETDRCHFYAELFYALAEQELLA